MEGLSRGRMPTMTRPRRNSFDAGTESLSIAMPRQANVTGHAGMRKASEQLELPHQAIGGQVQRRSVSAGPKTFDDILSDIEKDKGNKKKEKKNKKK